MAVNTILPNAAPGVASFGQHTFGSTNDIRFGDAEIVDTPHIIPVVAGANINLPIFSVIDKLGRLALSGGVAGTEPYAVLTSAISLLIGETDTVAVIRSGHLNMLALNWDASFNTDQKKFDAFVGSESPTLFVSKPSTDSANLY